LYQGTTLVGPFNFDKNWALAPAVAGAKQAAEKPSNFLS
jgi:hypothetical protein